LTNIWADVNMREEPIDIKKHLKMNNLHLVGGGGSFLKGVV